MDLLKQSYNPMKIFRINQHITFTLAAIEADGYWYDQKSQNQLEKDTHPHKKEKREGATPHHTARGK